VRIGETRRGRPGSRARGSAGSELYVQACADSRRPYEALLKSRRKELHRQLAQTIDERFPALTESHPEVLAQHWSEAGEIERAVGGWAQAGKIAEERNAFIEAQESYRQAIALLNRLPESKERDSRELEVRHTLVRVLRLTKGWVAPETIEAAARIGPLAEKSGELRKLIGSAQTKAFHACLAGDLSLAQALCDEALDLAQREGNPVRIAFVHTTQQTVHYFRGDLAGAERHFAEAVKFVDDPYFRQSPIGIVISVFGWASKTAWMRGRADLARERLALMKAAVNPANPHDLAWSSLLEAILYGFIGKYETSAALATRARDIAEKNRFPVEALHSRCWLGHAQAQMGRTSDGIELLRAGIDALPRAGDRTSVPLHMTYLAAAQLRAGRTGDALDTIEQGLNFISERTFGRPELLRILGEARLAREDFQLAEAAFRDSIATARAMEAKGWELRTTISLARMFALQGRHDEACRILAEIYGWFTEGFDTPDLNDAKSLLDELTA
jgi:tetratricopeptide (TPR) repeat protein